VLVNSQIVSQSQRKLFAKGLVDLANIVAGAMVFGQFAFEQPINLRVIVLGILFTTTFYLGGLGVSKGEGK